MGISIAFLALLGVYIFLIFNFRPLMGDDFSFYYYKEVSGYVDSDAFSDLTFQTKIGIPFSERLDILKNSYNTFSGRVISMLCSMFYSMINNRMVFAVLAVGIYIGVILLSARLIYRNVRETLQHPFVLILLGSFLLLYNEGVGNLYMFTMLFHYGVTYLLWLVLINFAMDSVYTKEKISTKCLILINIFGVFAGLTHEMIGALALLMIAAISIGIKGWKEGITYIKYYIGAAIGYVICFFAPGNFNRANTDHDAAILDPYSIKFVKSAKQHILTFFRMEEVGVVILGIAVFAFIILLILKIRKKEIISWKKALFWQICVGVSVLMWAAVSYVPKYGILLAMIAQIVAIMRLFDDPENKETNEREKNLQEKNNRVTWIFSGISILLVLAIFINLSWVPTMIHETREREVLVAEAAMAGKEEVIVPSYSERVTCHSVMVPNNLNNSRFYRGKKVSQVYYGTKIVVEGHDE